MQRCDAIVTKQSNVTHVYVIFLYFLVEKKHKGCHKD